MFPPTIWVNAGKTEAEGKVTLTASEAVVGTNPLTPKGSNPAIDEVGIETVDNRPGSNLLSKLIEAEVALATTAAVTEPENWLVE